MWNNLKNILPDLVKLIGGISFWVMLFLSYAYGYWDPIIGLLGPVVTKTTFFFIGLILPLICLLWVYYQSVNFIKEQSIIFNKNHRKMDEEQKIDIFAFIVMASLIIIGILYWFVKSYQDLIV